MHNEAEEILMSIDTNTAKRVANLARIEVKDTQLETLAGELNNVLAMIDQLQEVDIDGVEPMTSVMPMNAPLREDVVSSGDIQDEILKNAPLAREGFFAVPKVVE